MKYAIEHVIDNWQFYLTLAGAVSVVAAFGAYRARREDIYWGLVSESDATPRKRGRMLKTHRRQYVEFRATDGFVSFVEDEVARGEFTRAEANEIYRNLKKVFPIKNLFPAVEGLKENIRRRIEKLQGQDPVRFPDSKPKKKHMFDKA